MADISISMGYCRYIFYIISFHIISLWIYFVCILTTLYRSIQIYLKYYMVLSSRMSRYILSPPECWPTTYTATCLRLASDRMDECLKKSAEARKFSISLSTLEYSGDLVSSLQKFSVKMEQVFRLLQDLVGRKIEDEDQYKKHFAIVDERLQWYEKAEAGLTGLNTLCNGYCFKICFWNQFYALRKTVVVSTSPIYIPARRLRKAFTQASTSRSQRRRQRPRLHPKVLQRRQAKHE